MRSIRKSDRVYIVFQIVLDQENVVHSTTEGAKDPRECRMHRMHLLSIAVIMAVVELAPPAHCLEVLELVVQTSIL